MVAFISNLLNSTLQNKHNRAATLVQTSSLLVQINVWDCACTNIMSTFLVRYACAIFAFRYTRYAILLIAAQQGAAIANTANYQYKIHQNNSSGSIGTTIGTGSKLSASFIYWRVKGLFLCQGITRVSNRKTFHSVHFSLSIVFDGGGWVCGDFWCRSTTFWGGRIYYDYQKITA